MKMVISCGIALAVLGAFVVAAGAQTSCAGFFSQCKARCSQWSKEPVAKCTADHCTPKLNACRKTGCWTEGALYGGGRTCNLKKS